MKHKVKNIHFVGIGGSGMSGIAEVLVNQGYRSAARTSPTTRRRAAWPAGRASRTRHDARTSPTPTRSSCRPRSRPTTPRWSRRARAGIPVVPRAQMLAELMRLKQGIAIAGTHGKTTTTSLVASILAEGGHRPDLRDRRPAECGRRQRAPRHGRLPGGRGRRVRRLLPLPVAGDLGRHQHRRRPHGDLRPRLRRLKQAFVDFLQRLPFYGVAVLCADDANVREIMPARLQADRHLRPRRRPTCAPPNVAPRAGA
jgi:UDP-N-acetylmuramate--alanine ligase